jgi:hypothetical protein
MSVFNEQEPTSPQDLLHYAPRRRSGSERSGTYLRPSASPVGETKFDRPFRTDASSSPFAQPASLDAGLEDAIGETLRRHLAPQVMPEPTFGQQRSRRRNNSLTVGAGIAVAVGLAAAAALFVVKVLPVSRDFSTSSGIAAAAEFAVAPLDHAAKPAPSQSRSASASADGDQTLTHEQSEQLLDRFVQWRQKTDAAQH